MTNEVKNVPEIRFPEFSGEWEENKLNNYLKTSKIKNTQKKYNKQDVLSVSGDFGIVNQIEFQGRSFAGASVAPYGIVETGDIVYTKSPLKSSPYGIIKVNKGESGIVSTLYAIYKIKKNVDANFVEDYFTNDLRLNKYLKPLVNKGAKNDMKVSDDNALIGDVIFPKYIEEQIKISKFFSKLDRQIELEEQKLSLLEKQKKGYMQQIFSQKLRFKDENGNNYPEWEAQKLGEISDKGMYGIGASAIDFDGSNIYVRITDIDSDSNKMSKKHLKSPNIIDNKYKLKSNDLLFARTGASTGKSYIHKNYLEDKNYYFAGFLIKFAIKKPNSSEFVYQFTHTKVYDRWVKIMSMRSGQPGINSVEYSNLVLNIPRTKEQQKIGEFLNKFDELIEKQNQKIDVLKVRKQGFLQKMFI